MGFPVAPSRATLPKPQSTAPAFNDQTKVLIRAMVMAAKSDGQFDEDVHHFADGDQIG